MTKTQEALAQSVKARLVHRAHAERVEPNQLLSRFAIERFLYRLSRSRYADRFVLKGALLLLVWFGESIRPTRDADLLGFGNLDPGRLEDIFQEICVEKVEPDGMSFDPGTVKMRLIRQEDPYGGYRVTAVGHLGTARLPVQVDVGLGDAVIPEPIWLDYPTLLEHAAPHIRAYQPETTIAEKLHALVVLGTRTSRLRDFFDLRMLSAERDFHAKVLVPAVQATFERRDTPLPATAPPALTPAFSRDADKQAQWRAFLRKGHLDRVPENLQVVVAEVARFLLPMVEAARDERVVLGAWPAGGPWGTPAGD